MLLLVGGGAGSGLTECKEISSFFPFVSSVVPQILDVGSLKPCTSIRCTYVTIGSELDSPTKVAALCRHGSEILLAPVYWPNDDASISLQFLEDA